MTRSMSTAAEPGHATPATTHARHEGSTPATDITAASGTPQHTCRSHTASAVWQLLEERVSVNHFDSSFSLTDRDIETLVSLATRAPTAWNLQNWRFIAVRSAQAKQKLRILAFGQEKVEAAAVSFIICGVRPDPATLAERLAPSVEAGFMPADIPGVWQAAAQQHYADAGLARDEAIRSATFGAANLMLAAQAAGLVSCPMTGFDASGVAQAFGLASSEIPVLLLAVGRAAPGNWPQKPRRPLSEVLDLI